MGKLIAVWGSPGSGKTTFSVKLAEALYNRSRGKSAVIVVFTDIVTPTIPVIFPNFRSEDVFSVGTILTKPDFFADDVVSNMVMTKDRMNLGYLGYKDSENKHSFPDYTEEKAKYLYDVLVGIADYVIVDCMSIPDSNFLTSVTDLSYERSIFLCKNKKVAVSGKNNADAEAHIWRFCVC